MSDELDGSASWSLTEYLGNLAADLPTPGGGSAAALVGALAAALGEMVCNFTVGREKYAGVEAEMLETLASLEGARSVLTELIEADMAAYAGVKAAYRVPKDDPARASAIREALKSSAQVPLQVLEYAATVARLLGPLAEKGNPNLVSDVGVAAAFADAAASAAHLNVEVNLALLDDEIYVEEVSSTCQALRSEVSTLCAAALSTTLSAIHGER